MDMGSGSSMSGVSMAAMSGMSTMTGMASPSSTANSMSGMSSMGGMGGSMDMGAQACKINMLWNWYTIDACFLSSSWQIKSQGMFAGSCIGVIALVCVLELLRRVGREYDRLIVQGPNRRTLVNPRVSNIAQPDEESHSCSPGKDQVVDSAAETTSNSSQGDRGLMSGVRNRTPGSSRPTGLQQAIRSAIHMLQFAVAYFIMLLAMYYNGYIIICIFIGAFIGSFIFSWDLGAKVEPSGCCG